MTELVIEGINEGSPLTLHIDLNAAFASIEQQDRPELRGRPVIVASYANDASTLISPSREARLQGIKTGMRVFEAKRLYPGVVILEPRAWRYREVQASMLTLFDEYSPDVLPLSIDEAVIDLAGTPSEKRPVREVAQEIKDRVRSEVGDWLTSSVGIATNSYLAKIASGLKKPTAWR